jgi:hypothetical protein
LFCISETAVKPITDTWKGLFNLFNWRNRSYTLFVFLVSHASYLHLSAYLLFVYLKKSVGIKCINFLINWSEKTSAVFLWGVLAAQCFIVSGDFQSTRGQFWEERWNYHHKSCDTWLLYISFVIKKICWNFISYV